MDNFFCVLQTRSADFDFVFDAATNSEAALRIGKLLSRMFEKAWQAGVGEHRDDEHAVLNHITTWPSFHRFLGLFCTLQVLRMMCFTCSAL